ncbi:hypothetical protein VNI00_006784 [Paramarasmius palmivorus]|uniref:Uncharacterized protein n=1 Tax=Paramarasmius palmivorus TaxID=297713 RepID=A0AAW0D828_9AGAR
MSSIANKIRGAVDAVHGAGENIRGTTLGAADTIAHDQSAKNDEIAAKGRKEWANGVARMKGQPPHATSTTDATSYGTTSEAHGEPYRESGGLGPDRHKGGKGGSGLGNDSVDTRGHFQSSEASGSAPNTTCPRGLEYPQHHRDDAISNDQTAVRIGEEYRSSTQ